MSNPSWKSDCSSVLVVLAASWMPSAVQGGDIKIVEGIPPGFELVRLTDDPTMEHSVPDINDAGEVVFGKWISPDVGILYRFSGGMIRQITDGSNYDLNIVTNNFSQIAWNRGVSSGEPFDLVSDYVEGPISGDAHPANFIDMNDAGDIVWKHRPQVGVSEFDIYLYTHADGKVTQLTDGGNNQSARINNHGDVVWRLRDPSLQGWIGRIMLYSDGVITDITPGECACRGPDINDLGHVVWMDDVGVQFWNGETVTLITELASTPRINNAGEIALSKWNDRLQLWQHSIFKNGSLYILPDMGMSTSRRSLNDRGEMAMRSSSKGHRELFLLRRHGPKGDGNYDCRIDKRDFRLLQLCRTAVLGPEGTLLADCIRFDFDDDGDVDPVDYEVFLESFTGPDGSVPDCEP